MKRLAVVAALVAAGVAFWYLQRAPSTRSAAAADMARLAGTSAPGTPVSPSAPPTIKAVDKVTKLASPEERRKLADRIATAHAARGATRAAPLPRLLDAPDDSDTPINKTQIRAAIKEIVPHLVACYEAAIPTMPSPNFSMTAELTLTGDPDVGTIVDAGALSDHDGKPLPAKLDDCFRSTFMLMALPPLAEGDKLEVRYPFEFSAN